MHVLYELSEFGMCEHINAAFNGITIPRDGKEKFQFSVVEIEMWASESERGLRVKERKSNCLEN